MCTIIIIIIIIYDVRSFIVYTMIIIRRRQRRRIKGVYVFNGHTSRMTRINALRRRCYKNYVVHLLRPINTRQHPLSPIVFRVCATVRRINNASACGACTAYCIRVRNIIRTYNCRFTACVNYAYAQGCFGGARRFAWRRRRWRQGRIRAARRNDS